MSLSSQQRKILQSLRTGPKTSLELSMTGVLCYTKRISELRRKGHEILTEEEWRDGRRICTYTLLREPEEEK